MALSRSFIVFRPICATVETTPYTGTPTLPKEQDDAVADEQLFGAASDSTMDATTEYEQVSQGISELQLSQITNQQADILDDIKNLHSKIDQVDKTVKEILELLKQSDNIEGRLNVVVTSLEEIRKSFGGQTGAATTLELETRVTKLKEKVENLRLEKIGCTIDKTTLTERIEDIESEFGELLEQFQGVNRNIEESLNRHFREIKKMLLTLTGDVVASGTSLAPAASGRPVTSMPKLPPIPGKGVRSTHP